VRVALVFSAAASSLAPSSPIRLTAARGAHARWARRARAAIRSKRRAARRLCKRARVRRCHRGVGRGAAARTSEVQRGEGRVGLEHSGQLLGPLGADPIACGTRGARAVGAASARARAAVLRGWGGAPLHALQRCSVVRVALALSAAASSLAPSSPISFPAARGAHARWARRARAAMRFRRRAARPPPPARVCGCGGAAGVGRRVAARTLEVQRGEGGVGLERGGQLLRPLDTDPIDCGTRGARAVGAASACGNARWAARRTPPLHACACAAVPRGWGGAPLHAL